MVTIALLYLLVPLANASECLFINGNRSSMNQVYSFQVRDDAVPQQASGSPYSTGGIGGVQRTPDSLAATGDVLLALNSGNSQTEGSISIFRILDDCSLVLSDVSAPTPGFSYAMLLERSKRFVYVTNFEDDTISVFAGTSGKLSSLGRIPTPLRGPLDIIQDARSGIVYVVFRDSLGFGLFKVKEDGDLVFMQIEGSGLQWGLVPPSRVQRLYSFELNGNLHGHQLGGQGVLSTLPSSPWCGHAGTNDVIFSPRHGLLLSISESFRTVGAFKLDEVGVPTETEWSPVAVSSAVPRGLALDQAERQLYVISLNSLTTFSLEEQGLALIEPIIILPVGEKSAALSYSRPRQTHPR